MCELFVKADPRMWEATTRSMRLDGVVTSLRLENYFWSILEELAYRDSMPLSALVTQLYSEAIDEGHDMVNFASFLRVCCLRYLNLQVEDLIPKDMSQSIRSLPATDILLAERGLEDDASARAAQRAGRDKASS